MSDVITLRVISRSVFLGGEREREVFWVLGLFAGFDSSERGVLVCNGDSWGCQYSCHRAGRVAAEKRLDRAQSGSYLRTTRTTAGWNVRVIQLSAQAVWEGKRGRT